MVTKKSIAVTVSHAPTHGERFTSEFLTQLATKRTPRHALRLQISEKESHFEVPIASRTSKPGLCRTRYE
jgi:hypothetical protein